MELIDDVEYMKTQIHPHKYEANIFPSLDENEYFTLTEFSRSNFATFLTHVEKAINDFSVKDKPYAIIFKPDSDEALFKIHGSTIYGYIIEDLT